MQSWDSVKCPDEARYPSFRGVLLLREVSLYTRLLLLSLPSHAPIHSTFVCPTEILAFSDRVNEFKTINTEVVACSVDSKFTHFAWINTPREEGGLKGLKIPLLSDLTKQISKDYGVLLENEGHSLRLASLGNLLATTKDLNILLLSFSK